MEFVNTTISSSNTITVQHVQDDSYITGVRDFYLLLTLPILAYWTTATFYFLLEKSGLVEQYRIHTPEEFLKRNKVSLTEVFRSIILQQLIQTAFALCIDYLLTSGAPVEVQEPVYVREQQLLYIRNTLRMLFAAVGLDLGGIGSKMDGSMLSMGFSHVARSEIVLAKLVYWIGIPALQFAGAIVLADFWQYAWHRVFHENKFLYKHVHSYHHRIYVPYAYGALYNTLLEAFIVDTIGTTIVFGLTGYEIPYHPLDLVSKNNTAYHDIHHQAWGMKYNFSQVYLTFWDDVLGTTMSPEMASEKYAVQKERLEKSAT